MNCLISAPVAVLNGTGKFLVEQAKRNYKLHPNDADAQQLFMRTHPMTVPLTC